MAVCYGCLHDFTREALAAAAESGAAAAVEAPGPCTDDPFGLDDIDEPAEPCFSYLEEDDGFEGDPPWFVSCCAQRDPRVLEGDAGPRKALPPLSMSVPMLTVVGGGATLPPARAARDDAFVLCVPAGGRVVLQAGRAPLREGVGSR